MTAVVVLWIGRGLPALDVGQHEQQGVTVFGDFASLRGREGGGDGRRRGLQVHAGQRQRLACGGFRRFQVGGSLGAEKERPLVGCQQPVKQRIVAAVDELLVLLFRAMLRSCPETEVYQPEVK